MKKEKLHVSADGTAPIVTDDIKVIYSESEINTNWLLNKVFGTKGLQITKVSDNDVLKFLSILNESRLAMQDGTDSLWWLKKRLEKRYRDSIPQRGLTWENVSRRYQFIIQQIDLILATRSSNDH